MFCQPFLWAVNVRAQVSFIGLMQFAMEQSCVYVLVCIGLCGCLRMTKCLNVWRMTQAVETLKSFEKRDSKVAVAAATNLSFLYNLVQFNSHCSADIIFFRFSSFAIFRAGFCCPDVFPVAKLRAPDTAISLIYQNFCMRIVYEDIKY